MFIPEGQSNRLVLESQLGNPNLGFKYESGFRRVTQDVFCPQPHQTQSLLIATWVKYAFWRLCPPPVDVECVLQA